MSRGFKDLTPVLALRAESSNGVGASNAMAKTSCRGIDMPKPLTGPDVVERLHVNALESYALTLNVVKGIALGVGSLVLLQILSDFQSDWLRLLPWSASLVGLLISYLKWTRGALLTNARANLWDSFFPLLMGAAEFLLFAVLAVDREAASSDLWLNWPLCWAAWNFAAAALVNNRLRLTNVERDFTAELSGLGNEFKGWLRADRWQAGLLGLFGLVLWILGRAWMIPTYGTETWAYVVGAFASLCFIAAWKPVSDANSQRNRIDDFVTPRVQSHPAGVA
jgi:hypothetical protein